MEKVDVASARDWRVWLLSLLALLPILTTYLLLWRNALNIPYMDDYDAILGFANVYHRLPSLQAKLLYINDAMHVQYKLIALHSIVAMDLAIQHNIDFVAIQWLGNISLLLIAFCLWKMLPGDTLRDRLIFCLPACCLLFLLRDSEAMDWAMDCLQLVAVVGYALLAFWLFCGQQRERFAGGCIAFALATWSSANGLLVLPVALLILWQRRSWHRVAVLLGVAAVVLLSYFHGYHPDLPVPDGSPSSIAIAPAFYLALLGALFSRVLPAAIFGSVLLCATVPVVWRALWRDRRLDAVSASMLFLVLNAALMTVGRFRLGLVGAVASRYSIYSQVLAALVYIAYLRPLARRTTSRTWLSAQPWRYWGMAAVAMVLFVHYERIGARLLRERTAASLAHMAAWENYGPESSLVALDNPIIQKNWARWIPHASDVLTKSIQQQIYVPPRLSAPEATPEFFRRY